MALFTRGELARLRAWLEVDRGVDFAACPFLYEVIDTITGDGEITDDELDTLASAIERVLPPEIRKHAAERRKQQRTARSRSVENGTTDRGAPPRSKLASVRDRSIEAISLWPAQADPPSDEQPAKTCGSVNGSSWSASPTIATTGMRS